MTCIPLVLRSARIALVPLPPSPPLLPPLLLLRLLLSPPPLLLPPPGMASGPVIDSDSEGATRRIAQWHRLTSGSLSTASQCGAFLRPMRISEQSGQMGVRSLPSGLARVHQGNLRGRRIGE